ncbi:MAG: serine O-acetyltransferase EpsC [Vicinamibacterales bacterium]|nr:serine O-acetyltransferase EpsC [Vicinamibacterales bacterium]
MMRWQPWADAVELARAERLRGDWRGALRMMRTDAYWLLFLFRVRRLCQRLHVPLVNRLLRMCQMVFGGVEMGNAITLGSGVYFVHSLGTVIGGTAQVGARVRFMGNNTVGTARDNGYPVIGDDVEVGCGARILGPVRIGHGAVIGANAVVLSDVPAGGVAVGIPARIIKVSVPQMQLVANGERGR